MTSNHVSGLFFLSCPQNPSINHLNFHCIKQIDNIFPCVCTVIDHRRRHSVQRTTVTPLDVVLCRTFLFFTRCDVICDLLQYTHTGKCYLFVKYTISSECSMTFFTALQWVSIIWLILKTRAKEKRITTFMLYEH